MKGTHYSSNNAVSVRPLKPSNYMFYVLLFDVFGYKLMLHVCVWRQRYLGTLPSSHTLPYVMYKCGNTSYRGNPLYSETLPHLTLFGNFLLLYFTKGLFLLLLVRPFLLSIRRVAFLQPLLPYKTIAKLIETFRDSKDQRFNCAMT